MSDSFSISATLAQSMGSGPLWILLAVLAALVVLSCIVPLPKTSAYATILEAWAKYIIERFWKDNQFLKNAYDMLDE